MKVFILTEGGKNTGFGHLARCCAIYDAFSKRGVLPELIINGDGSISAFLKGKRCKVFDWLKNRNELFAAMNNESIVIVDSYLADIDFYKKLSDLVKLPVYLDDSGRLKYPRGIIVNGAVYANELSYPKGQGRIYLLGTMYTPLQKEFWLIRKHKINRIAKRILVTFGGARNDELIFKVLSVLSYKFPDLEKMIVADKSFSAKEMRDIMLNSDIAISGGGQTLYELARIGVPTIVVSTARNQSDNIKGWKRKGFVKYAGKRDDKNLPVKLIDHLKSILDYKQRVKMSGRGRTCVDGKGAVNLVKYILNIKTVNKDNSTNISLRKADKNDCRDLWSWRNNPNVRARSFDKRKICYKNHEKWFINKINDSMTDIFIAENDFLGKIGQIRFDNDKGQSAYVNVNLNPIFFGAGFGAVIIEKATKMFMENEPRVSEIIAEIIDDNEASKKAFLRAGYIFSRNTIKNNTNISVFKFRGNSR